MKTILEPAEQRVSISETKTEVAGEKLITEKMPNDKILVIMASGLE